MGCTGRGEHLCRHDAIFREPVDVNIIGETVVGAQDEDGDHGEAVQLGPLTEDDVVQESQDLADFEQLNQTGGLAEVGKEKQPRRDNIGVTDVLPVVDDLAVEKRKGVLYEREGGQHL